MIIMPTKTLVMLKVKEAKSVKLQIHLEDTEVSRNIILKTDSGTLPMEMKVITSKWEMTDENNQINDQRIMG